MLTRAVGGATSAGSAELAEQKPPGRAPPSARPARPRPGLEPPGGRRAEWPPRGLRKRAGPPGSPSWTIVSVL